MLIVCEGSTERTYFEGLRERGSNVKIHCIDPRPTDCLGLMESAVVRSQMYGLDFCEGDLAFCVFDVDENPMVNIDKAIRMGLDNGIISIISNPCFELWYLLHFHTVKDKLHRDDVVRLVSKMIKGYRKGSDYNPILTPLRGKAMQNAERCVKVDDGGSPYEIIRTNPSTNVHHTIIKIDILKARNRM